LLEVSGEGANEICNLQDQASPLHFAILSKNYANAKLLLKYGALPNHKDSTGNTPMHLAVSLRNLTMVRLLDQYNADASIKNRDGVNAIDIAVTEDIKDVRLHFISQRKYKNMDFS
jgi:ankyrin repeat protein